MRVDTKREDFLAGAAPIFSPKGFLGEKDGANAFAWAEECASHVLHAWEAVCPNMAPHAAVSAAKAFMRGEISAEEAERARADVFWCAEIARYATHRAGVAQEWGMAGYTNEAARGIAHAHDMDAMWPGCPGLVSQTPPRPAREFRRSPEWERAHAAANAARILVDLSLYKGCYPLVTGYAVNAAAKAAMPEAALAEREWQWERLRGNLDRAAFA